MIILVCKIFEKQYKSTTYRFYSWNSLFIVIHVKEWSYSQMINLIITAIYPSAFQWVPFIFNHFYCRKGLVFLFIPKHIIMMFFIDLSSCWQYIGIIHLQSCELSYITQIYIKYTFLRNGKTIFIGHQIVLFIGHLLCQNKVSEPLLGYIAFGLRHEIQLKIHAVECNFFTLFSRYIRNKRKFPFPALQILIFFAKQL